MDYSKDIINVEEARAISKKMDTMQTMEEEAVKKLVAKMERSIREYANKGKWASSLRLPSGYFDSFLTKQKLHIQRQAMDQLKANGFEVNKLTDYEYIILWK